MTTVILILLQSNYFNGSKWDLLIDKINSVSPLTTLIFTLNFHKANAGVLRLSKKIARFELDRSGVEAC